MTDRSYAVITDRLSEIGRVCHEANRAYCTVVGDPALPPWDDLDDDDRESTRQGVERALNGTLSADLHALWVRERTAAGWVYGETLDRERKIHPNLVPYHDLPESQRRKDQLFRAIVRVLGNFSET